ncbi:MAG: 2-oxoglutarate dehydrogenase E1 component [Pseudomonadota bacterium]|nr:2-oxoglutarate dehydrogenase E1 component [Pseudomonadota bacterium]
MPSMLEFLKTSHISGTNAEYIDAMYEQYLSDPNNISDDWRDFFDQLPADKTTIDHEMSHDTVRDYFQAQAKAAKRHDPSRHNHSESSEFERKQVKVIQLIAGYRNRGHQAANLDPLGLMPRETVPDLDIKNYGLTEADYDSVFQAGSLYMGKNEAPLSEIIDCLKNTYCGNVGAEYMHIVNTVEKRWIQKRLESVRSHPEYSKNIKKEILSQLTASEGLENHLASKYPGTKRFGLEGGESLIPAISEIIQRAGSLGAKEIVLGMAHRGRLNVLVNILGKKPTELFDEFEDRKHMAKGSGDVKYHQGFSSNVKTKGGEVHVALAFNPSHLEIVSPVVEGSVRARQDRRNDNERKKVLPLSIHGDAAFAGQGVVMETFQMSQTRGFATGGTVHIIVNNQVGFTTSKRVDARSTEYCTDVAKMVQAPIFHVNADNPEAVYFVTQLAVDYRYEFGKDVVIDLICYRKHGHNEADEPSVTQPVMYKTIRNHDSTRKLYAQELSQQGVVSDQEGIDMMDDYRTALEKDKPVAASIVLDPHEELHVDWSPYVGHDYTPNTNTQYDLDKLKALADELTTIPDTIDMQRAVKNLIRDRKKMTDGELALNWGYAETLAYATLLVDGLKIRMTGQDCRRGTFSHRHAAIFNQKDGQSYLPLTQIENGENFWIYDSLLSEEAALAYEYGYATTTPDALILWEAQFGDFANGAQVVIDQFISSGEFKWGRVCGLTMLLPHGYEGQGPEHSSARLERFLQLCAEKNMEVCAPTTPAQIFHLLRRQAKRLMRKPLIIMSPKSLLRHPQATSELKELSDGQFNLVLDDPTVKNKKKVNRIILCQGKVYYDIKAEQEAEELSNTAVIRLEQLYPPPKKEIEELLSTYENFNDLVWCQEEPRNQGAFYRMQFELNALMAKICDQQGIQNSTWHMRYAGRPASASTAVGYASIHAKEQKRLVRDALGLDKKEGES